MFLNLTFGFNIDLLLVYQLWGSCHTRGNARECPIARSYGGSHFQRHGSFFHEFSTNDH